jgi:hypothetical protein
LFARDPLSGENAPGGPMYNRDGTPRASWFDPLGFAGLDKTPPPSSEPAILRGQVADLRKTLKALEASAAERTEELQRLGAVWKGWKASRTWPRSTPLGVELRQGRGSDDGPQDLSQNRVVLDGLLLRLQEIERAPRSPGAYSATSLPVPASPVSRAVEMWAALSIALLFFGVAALLVWAPQASCRHVILVIAFGLWSGPSSDLCGFARKRGHPAGAGTLIYLGSASADRCGAVVARGHPDLQG